MAVITMTREMGTQGSRVAQEVCARLGLKFVERGLPQKARREILDLAAAGDVLIRGWGVNYVLEPVQHVLRVRVWAPVETRLQNVCLRMQSVDVEKWRREIEESDRNQLAVLEQLCGIDNWQDPSHYNLALDTSRLSVGQCADRIVRLAESPHYQPSTGSLRMLDSCFGALRRAETRA
jgi:cytidylate kinase